MKLRILAVTLLLFFLPAVTLAAPSSDMVAELIKIAEPDQIEAFSKLNLSERQEEQLLTLARGYAPQLQSAKDQPVRLMGLMSQALAEADKVLTPAQRPLLRKLMPRPHQWKKLKRLSSEMRP